MNTQLLKHEIQEFIASNLNEDINKILLKKSPFEAVSTRDLATQIDGKKRSQKKLPLWFKTSGIYFPPKLNLEQTSSESTAEYKSQLAKGDILVDLTGGFGVDSYYFSKRVKQVYHVEQNAELSDIAAHNSRLLSAQNLHFVKGDSLEYLRDTQLSFDTIYVDPARRVQTRKVFLLKDTEPDVVSNLPLLLSKASRIIIKTSPLFDIQSGLKELSNVREVHVISVKNDCKELLWVIDKNFNGEARIIASALQEHQLVNTSSFSFFFSEERNLALPEASTPANFLYEPDVALLKAGCFKMIANRYTIRKLHVNTHLYTSDQAGLSFIGKVYRVNRSTNYGEFSKLKQARKANVISRNFPYSPEQIKKKHKISDGGELFLFFCMAADSRLLVIEAERIE
ncbi:class I SAM-dependent methyltransferase [Desertivirga xinjiangensis]|uniref:class I SAM-dependent methyltransferase n=1 Tax=Desertivirga xinjiangensis TaxID=539206 RepID=UPI002109E32D|nr:class I SAM-dependent methyltransferase [Pedobacter xinjiangensis]